MQRHQLEYCWGLHKFELDIENDCNAIKCEVQKIYKMSTQRNALYVVRPSIRALRDNWMLVPTEETLTAMLQMQQYNTTCPIDQRRHYLQVSRKS